MGILAGIVKRREPTGELTRPAAPGIAIIPGQTAPPSNSLLARTASGIPNQPQPAQPGMFAGILEKRKGIEGGQGFWRSLIEDPIKFVPGLGVGVRAGRFAGVVQSSRRLSRNDPEEYFRSAAINAQAAALTAGPGQIQNIQEQADALRARDQELVENYFEEVDRKYTTGGQIGRIVGDMPAFMIDFLATGGLKKLGEGVAKQIGKRLLKDRAKSLVGRAAIGTTAFLSGAAFRSAGMPQRAAESILKRQLPQGITYGPEGEISIQGSGENPWTSIVKGLGDHYIEILSEQSGEVAAPILGKALRKAPFLGKLIPKIQKKWLALPANKLKSAADFSTQIGSKTGFNGVISEIGEEFLGDSLRAVFDIDDFGAGKDAGILERVNAAIERDIENLPVMAAAFAIPGVTRFAGSRVLAGRQPDVEVPEETITAEQLRPALREQFKEDVAASEADSARIDDQQDAEEAQLDAQLDSIAEELREERTEERIAVEASRQAAEVVEQQGFEGEKAVEVPPEQANVFQTQDGEIIVEDPTIAAGEEAPTELRQKADGGTGVFLRATGEELTPAPELTRRKGETPDQYRERIVQQRPGVETGLFGQDVITPLAGEQREFLDREDFRLAKPDLPGQQVIPEGRLTPEEEEEEVVETEVEAIKRVNPSLFNKAQKATNVDEFIDSVVKAGKTTRDKVSIPVLTDFYNRIQSLEEPAQPAPSVKSVAKKRGVPESAKSTIQKMIERDVAEEFGLSEGRPAATTQERTEEELTGLSKARRSRIKGQTATTILQNEVYQAALEAQDVTERQIDVGLYFVDKSGKGEIEQVIESVPKGRFKTQLRQMFTFERSDLIEKGGKAISWDVAAQEGLGRGREGVAETEGDLDITEFAERVKQALEGKKPEPGTRRLNSLAMDTAAEEGEPFIEMMVNKFRMLHNGSTKEEINNMILDVADHFNIDESGLVDDLIDGDQIVRLQSLPDATADEEIDRLAEQQVEAEDLSDAEGAAKDILEKNGIDVHIEQVEEITAEELKKRQGDLFDDVPFEVRGKPTGATLTLSDRQIILLANGADSQTGYHEGYHVIRPRLTARDHDILARNFANEEAEAAAFGQYAQDQSTQKGAVKFIFEKLMRFLRQIKSALQGAGFRTAESIFQDITTGQIRKVNPFLGNARTSFELKEPSDVFYSKLERAVTAKMPNKMDAQAFKNWLTKQGIKPDETKWTGIDDLIEKGGVITKQQVQETLETNDVQIEEVVKSGESAKERGIALEETQRERNRIDREQIAIADELSVAIERGLSPQIKDDLNGTFVRRNLFLSADEPLNLARTIVGIGGMSAADNQKAQRIIQPLLSDFDWDTVQALSLAKQDVRQERDDLLNQQGEGDETQFEQYTLPGGTNYREVLLTLPLKEGEPFQSPHFPETNILTHLRLTDRTNKEGQKVLFIEEIQSDWMQAGRKRGFKEQVDATNWTAKKGAPWRRPGGPANIYLVLDAEGKEVGSPVASSEQEAIELAAEIAENADAVPDAPFRKTWHELAFKRVLRFAAEEGYNVVAWTTGEQQADRFDLSQAVDALDWTTIGQRRAISLEGVKGVSDQTLEILVNTESGIVEVVDIGGREFEGKELADIVGKDIAEKILKNETGRLEGEGLKIGGQGMKAFYDRHIPNFARKYLKKWGGTVGTTEIEAKADPRDLSTPVTVHAVDVTPAMSKSVLEGQVKFERKPGDIQREAEKKARVQAKAARMKAARKPRVSKARLKFQTQVETPFLREDLAPAELPPGKFIQPAEPPIEGIRKKLPGPTFSEEGMKAHRDAVKRTLKDAVDAKGRNWALELQRKLIVMSSRLNDIDPLLASKVRRFEFDTMTNIVQLLTATAPFVSSVKAIEKISKTDAKDLQYALENQWRDKTNELLEKYSKIEATKNIRAEYEIVRDVLNELYNAGQEVGFASLFRANHFPRRVKHLEELTDHLQTTEDWSAFNTAIQKRKDQAGGRELKDSEISDVINTLLRGFRTGGVSLSRPGVVKHRSIPEFDANIARFYFPIGEALELYIRDMVQMTAARHFFGKQTAEITKLRKRERGLMTRLHKTQTRVGLTRPVTEEKHKEHISKAQERLKDIHEELFELQHRTIDQSIGAFTLDLQARHKLSPPEQRRVSEMLKAIMEPKGLGPNMNLFAKASYMTLLSNIPVALTQLQELGLSWHADGWRAIPAASKALFRKNQVEILDLGFEDIDQFTKDLGLNEIANTFTIAMRTTDRFGKQTLLNTLMARSIRLAKKKPNNAAFVSEMQRVFGDEFRNVINDLAAERITDNVKFLMFSKILDVQPLALSETPEGFAIGGNGRILYFLRLFQLRRFNMVRDNLRKVLKESPRKDPVKWVRALLDLADLIAILTLFGIGIDAVKAFWLGKDFDLTDSFWDNLLEFALLSNWTVREASIKDPVSLIFEELTPPVKLPKAIFQDIRSGKLEKSIRSVPYFGEEYYWWFGGGSRKGERNEFLDIYDPFN